MEENSCFNANKTGNTLFSSASPGEGNHWFDYTGDDTNNDGVGDTPYIVPGPTGGQDLYPMMEPYGWESTCNIRWS